MIGKRSLASFTNVRLNNFDFIRLIAASLVVLSHSFVLSTGYINGQDPDPVFQLDGRINLGTICVLVFFIISGYLVTMSYDHTKNVVKFMQARFLRIFPALIIMVLLVTFGLGAVLTTDNAHDYFTNPTTIAYLANIRLHNNMYLPGVFQHNVYPNMVNGALWSLRYEFECYLVAAALGVLGLLRKDVALALFVLSCVLWNYHYGNPDVQLLLNQLKYFSAGMMFYLYRDEIPMNKWIFALSSLLAIGCIYDYRPITQPFLILFGSYILFYVAYLDRLKLFRLTRWGDFSYGIYIFTFPIQQTVVYFFGGHDSWWETFSISLPIGFVIAVLSWHLVEKHALRLKKFQIPIRIPNVKKAPTG